MTTPIKYRISSTATKPVSDTVKGAPLTSLEIDGNFRSIKDSIELIQSAYLPAGYSAPVDYVAGVILSSAAQTVAYQGEVYAPKAAEVPFTTSGVFEVTKFVQIQSVASVDLTATDGASLVGYDGGTVQDVLDAVTGPNGSGSVGYMPAGTGTVVTTVQAALRRVISVDDFRLPSDADDTNAVQKFFNALAATVYDEAVMAGNLTISAKVSLTSSLTKTINCNAVITSAFAAEDEMVLFKDTPYLKLVGRLEVIGQGGITYSTRTNGVGVKVNNCLRFSGDYVRTAYFKYKGVQIENGTTEGGGNSSLWAFDRLRLEECGSGLANTVRGVRKNFTSRTDNGSSGSLSQTTTLTLDSMPTGLEQYTLCKIGSTVCALTAAPSGNNITVFPWPDTSLSTGTVDFYIGGGLYVKGGDTSVGEIGTIDATGCSVGYNAMSLYPASIQNFVSQANGIGLAIGRGGNTSSVGGQIDSSYFELDDFDIVKTTVAIVSFNISNALITDSSKVISLSPRLTDNTISTTYNAMRGVAIRIFGKPIQDRPILVANARTLSFDQKPGFIESLRANTATVTLAALGDGGRLYNNSDTAILVAGSGINNRPTGTITFAPPAEVAINGGVAGGSAAFSNFTGPCLFYVRADSATAYTVQRMEFNNTQTIEASATYTPPTLADGAGTATTFAVSGAEMGDFVEVSYDKNLQDVLLTAWVSAAGTVNVRFQNESGITVALTAGTIRVRVRKP